MTAAGSPRCPPGVTVLADHVPGAYLSDRSRPPPGAAGAVRACASKPAARVMWRPVSGPVVPAAHAREWAARLKRARLAEFPGARHDILNETVHRDVATAITDFILTAG